MESFHRIRSRGPADHVAIDLHVRVAPKLSMQDANAIADEVRRRLLALPGVDDVTVHAEAERGPESIADLQTAAKLTAQELGLVLHECWVQAADDHRLAMHTHVGVDPNLSLSAAHDLVDRFEQTLMARRTDLQGVYSHIELATPDILPSARVSRGLQERIHTAVVQATETIPELRDPHEIHVRQVEGKLFITLEVLVDGELSVTEAHELSTRLQEAIRASVPNVSEALVHVEPQDNNSQTTPA